MKFYLKHILIIILLISVTAPAFSQRKKVGVVLSGGGAKGVAHINALKVIEEAGIPIDYITGTSMGAIIGGLYAIGYDTHTLDSMVRSQNWTELLSDRVARKNLSFSEKENKEKYILTVPLTQKKKIALPSGLVGGNNVYNLLTELCIDYHDSMSFRELPIPFACVAYDMVSGKAVTLDHGYLPQAIRASMSIPGAFEPVRIDSMVLIDGGISNNFPANVVKEMGAEIIIGVDVSSGKRGVDDIKNLSDMFNQITYFTGLESYEENRELIDLYIHPNIEPYNAASFNSEAIDSLLIRGECAARAKWDELIALKSEIGIPVDYQAERLPEIELNKPLEISEISFEGLRSQKESTLLRVSRLKENTEVTPDEIQTAVARLQGMGTLSEVSYRLEGDYPYNLVFKVKESSPNSISLGLRFDTEEMAAILLNINLATANMSNSHFEVTGRLSENPYVRGAYVLGNETERMFTFSYRFKYNDLNLYHHGDKLSNMDYGQHLLDINYSNIQVRNFKVGLGVRYEYNDFNNTITSRELDVKIGSQGLVSYYATAQIESLDKKYSPTKGISFRADYTLYTTNFITNNGKTPYSALHMDFLAPFSVSRRVAFLPGVFGRVIIGHDPAFPALNFMGGAVPGRYMPQQMPFVGIHRLEAFDNAVIGAKLDFRVRLWVKNFVSLKMNYAKEDNDFFDLATGRDIWGVGLAYNYQTIIGPFDLQVDYSNRTKKVGFYFNLGYYF